MDGRIASIALVVAAAWGSIAENSWCLRHAQSVLDAETDDMRAKKRLRTMTADLDRITDQTRAPIIRSTDGWYGSTLYGYVYLNETNDGLHRKKFRMCMENIDKLCDKLKLSSVYRDKCEESGRPASTPGRKPVPLKFRVCACLYTFAHGGDLNLKADVAGIADITLRGWLYDFCNAVQEVIQPEYMPSGPPSDDVRSKWREKFASRRGVPNIALACDGTHVRFISSDDDYRNYKGWHSILALAFVNSFHMFVHAEVGWPGRAGDNTALKHCKFLEAVRQDREAWLGDDLIAGDGGATDGAGDDSGFFTTNICAILASSSCCCSFILGSFLTRLSIVFVALPRTLAVVLASAASDVLAAISCSAATMASIFFCSCCIAC